jgi:tetratricopeptide (TPR) repeat protein
MGQISVTGLLGRASFRARETKDEQASCRGCAHCVYHSVNARGDGSGCFQGMGTMLGGEGRDPDLIIAGCTAVIQRHTDPPRRLAIALNNRGVAFKAKGDFDHALQDYDKSIQLDPHAAHHYNNRGVIYRIKGDLVRAVEEYGKAIVLKPDYIAAYYNRALAYRDMGQLNNALADFNSALQVNPYNEYALYQRGLLKQKMNDLQGAAADIAAAKSTNPELAKEFERPPTQ